MRYLVFAGSCCYPDGGMNDWYATCETFGDAMETVNLLNTRSYDWYHIFDVEDRTIVARGSV